MLPGQGLGRRENVEIRRADDVECADLARGLDQRGTGVDDMRANEAETIYCLIVGVDSANAGPPGGLRVASNSRRSTAALAGPP